MEGVRGATARAAAAAARAAGLELGLEDVAVAEAAGDGPVEGAPQLHQVVLRAISRLMEFIYGIPLLAWSVIYRRLAVAVMARPS